MARNIKSILNLIFCTLKAYQENDCDEQTCKDTLNFLLRTYSDKLIEGPGGAKYYGWSYSECAMAELNKPALSEKIVYDHAIPIYVIVHLLMSLISGLTIRDIWDLDLEIQGMLRVVAITESENRRLDSNGLKQEMPKGWAKDGDKYARYKEVLIDIVHSETETEAALNRIRSNTANVRGIGFT